MTTSDPTWALVFGGVVTLFTPAVAFEVAVRWLRSSLHSKGSLAGD